MPRAHSRSLLAALSLALLAGCAVPRAMPTRPRVEDVTLAGAAEVAGMYTRTYDGHQAHCYTFTADGAVVRQLFPDERTIVRGRWRLLNRQSAEIEWSMADGTVLRERLHFVAFDGKLGFIEDSARNALAARPRDWRYSLEVFVKSDLPPPPAPRLDDLPAFPAAQQPAARAAQVALVAEGAKPQEYVAHITPTPGKETWTITLTHRSHPAGDQPRGDACGRCRSATFDPATGTLSRLMFMR